MSIVFLIGNNLLNGNQNMGHFLGFGVGDLIISWHMQSDISPKNIDLLNQKRKTLLKCNTPPFNLRALNPQLHKFS